MYAAERKLLLHLLGAMINLYGIVPKEKAIEAWHRHYPDLTPATNADLGRLDLEGAFFLRVDECFAHESLFFEDDSEYKELLSLQAGKPYYEPETEELLKYSDDLYYEMTVPFATLLQFVQKERLAIGKTASDLVEDIQLHCMCMGMQLRDVMMEFERRDIEFTSEPQLRELMPLIMDLSNHSRVWPNRGFTPFEMGGGRSLRKARAEDRDGSARPPQASKHGRNDPCPCGSGKKFKHCCGNPQSAN